jgi:tetratricopeptide (TPR) repeat protein
MPRAARRTLKLPATLVCLLASALACAAQAQPSPAQPRKPEQTQKPEPGKTLEQLRQDYAVGFLDPAPHMALAKYFRDHGNRLQAFYILEAARRTRFEQDEFNAAFKTYFLGEEPFDNSKEAEAKLLARLARDPASQDTLFKLADIYISREDWPKAKEYLGKLIALRPENFEDTKALAEVYEREGNEAGVGKLLHEWARKYPETPAAYRIRVEDVPETEADKAKALLAEAMKKFPQEADFPFYLAGIYLREGKTKEAEPLFVKAAELAPDSANVQAWVGRFFFKAEEDERRALEYYLSAYLLDPDAYETEYVESRIPRIDLHLAAPLLQDRLKRGAPLVQIAQDPDPGLAHLALEEMEKNWRPDYLKALVGIMAHDDGGVRWQATELLKSKVDRSFDETLRALLQDPDLRRRGLAAYLAVHLWHQASFDLMRKMLEEDAQLLRFDAASALILEGGPEGRQIALEHRLREPHPRLKKLLEAEAQQSNKPQ